MKNRTRSKALELLREAGALDRDDPQDLRFRSYVLTFAASHDDLLRRIGWFGRLQMRLRWTIQDWRDRIAGRAPASRWP